MKMMKLLSQKKPKKIIFFDIDRTMFDTEHFYDTKFSEYRVFKEVKEVLERLSVLTNLGIFSKGEEALQLKKLDKTGIKKYFKENYIHIVEDKYTALKNILKNYNDHAVVFADDDLNSLHLAKKLNKNLITIWVKRGKHAQKQGKIAGFNPDFILTDLSKILEILR